MDMYRCYFVTTGRRVVDYVDITADTDEAALQQAREAFAERPEHRLELWKGSQRLHVEERARA
jgi:hypothetical protein